MLYTAETAPIDEIFSRCGYVARKRGLRKKYKEREMFDIVGAFDIETSTLHFPAVDGKKHNSHAFMYIWMYQIGSDCTITGRTWEEWKLLLSRIDLAAERAKEDMGFEQKPLFITYVHNLAFEFSFISDPDIYNFMPEDCFFRDVRKPIYCRMNNSIELRCSYLQSNMTLEKFAENMGCTTRKLDGQRFDYTKVRFPWTQLSDYEFQYCIHDVICLEEAIRLEMQKDGDTLRTIPLTSTGYVRRDCKAALFFDREKISAMQPDIEQYRILREAFRGGNTHASRYYAGHIIDNVESYDMASCYPAQQLTKPFPMSAPLWMDEGDDLLERVIASIGRGNAVVARYSFENLRLKNPQQPDPYLSVAKCKVLFRKVYKRRKHIVIKSYKTIAKELHTVKYYEQTQVDNGRILKAPYVIASLTEIDLQIVLNQYTFSKIAVHNAFTMKKAMLPRRYREVIMDYYKRKTELKGVAGKEYEYNKSKNKLNSVYGMSAQDPVHQNITYNNGLYTRSDYANEETLQAIQKAPFPYQWGVYTTAYARAALQEGLDLVNGNGESGEYGSYVYCDTDSIKTVGKPNITQLNKRRIKLAEDNGAYADDKKGIRHYIGVFERETPYDRFVTQGAKRYAFEHGDKIGITVSGVTHKKNPDTGIQYCVEEMKALENFVPGMTWYRAGGTAAVYNDSDNFEYTDDETGKSVHIGKNVAIVSSTYELQYSKDYNRLLTEVMLWKEYEKKIE